MRGVARENIQRTPVRQRVARTAVAPYRIGLCRTRQANVAVATTAAWPPPGQGFQRVAPSRWMTRFFGCIPSGRR